MLKSNEKLKSLIYILVFLKKGVPKMDFAEFLKREIEGYNLATIKLYTTSGGEVSLKGYSNIVFIAEHNMLKIEYGHDKKLIPIFKITQISIT